MAEFEKLINIDLKLQNNKEEIAITKDFKSYLFESLYTIQEYYGIYKFIDIIFVIIEFIQLMAFPMDKVFNKTWGDNWVKTIGNFFRFFQLIWTKYFHSLFYKNPARLYKSPSYSHQE